MEFITDSGIRIPGVTKEQMMEIDRIAMQEIVPNLYQMMGNAVAGNRLPGHAGLWY